MQQPSIHYNLKLLILFIVDTHRKQNLDDGKFYEQAGSRVIQCQ